ncbi:hypothetical protein LSAT2_029480 [Lamellibrachia satsuma]|nr:hypothetical protein LSAT2_029480 [Lamellibrachia satsuma]
MESVIFYSLWVEIGTHQNITGEKLVVLKALHRRPVEVLPGPSTRAQLPRQDQHLVERRVDQPRWAAVAQQNQQNAGAGPGIRVERTTVGCL